MPGPKPLKPLTGEQHAFLLHYMEHANASEAYRQAFGNDPRAGQRADQLLKSPAVQQTLRLIESFVERRQAVAERTEGHGVAPLIARYAISRERAAQMLAKLAASDVRDYLEWGPDGVHIKPSAELTEAQSFGIVEVREISTKHGKTVVVKLADKRQALMDIARLQGWLDKPEDAPAPLADQEKREEARKRLFKFLMEMAKPEPLVIEGDRDDAESAGRDGRP